MIGPVKDGRELDVLSRGGVIRFYDLNMNIELLYKRMYGYRFKIAEYISVSLVMNYLSDQDVLNGSQTVVQKMTDLNNSAVFVLVLLLGFALIFYLLLMLAGWYARRQNLSAAFTDIMKAHTAEIALPAISGGLSWGQNRTVWLAPNMVLGLEPKVSPEPGPNDRWLRNGISRIGGRLRRN